MRIKRITIKEYKNIKDFECVFSESNITGFIGKNGSGKSNLLEVVSKAFSNAKNYAASRELSIIPPHEKPMVLDCRIEYNLRGTNYLLYYNSDVDGLMSRLFSDMLTVVHEEISISRDGKKLSRKAMDSALPDSVLLYYAGETLRQKGIAEETYDSYYEVLLKRANSSALPSLRFMDCLSINDLPLLLLTAAAYKGEYFFKFLDQIGCTEIRPNYSIILTNPGKGKHPADTFWNATGFVKYFLEDLRRLVSSTRDSGGSQYYMFFDNAEDLQKISENEYDLFAKLKALRHYGFLQHISIIFRNEENSVFSSLRLSEGEKLLGMLFLLTTFTAKRDCLYLFDEFDAYLHLNWQRSFSQMVRESDIQGHLLFTTHSPATISMLMSDELFIMKNGKVEIPSSEIYNRALDEIMLEQMDVSMRSPEIEKLYDSFKQCIADKNKEGALLIMHELENKLDESDPLFDRMKINLRRI